MTSQVEGLARFDLSRRSAVQLLLLLACLLQGEFVLLCVLKKEFRETGLSKVIIHKAACVDETLDLNISLYCMSLFLYCKLVNICSIDNL